MIAKENGGFFDILCPLPKRKNFSPVTVGLLRDVDAVFDQRGENGAGALENQDPRNADRSE